jgi:hypothetical protein
MKLAAGYWLLVAGRWLQVDAQDDLIAAVFVIGFVP